MARTTRLLDIPEATITILIGYIRQGAYPYVAAKAIGVPSSTWFRWMDWGKKGGKERAIYRELWEKVEQAHAQARVLAEAEVRKDNPFAWLRYGPGRERPGEPGWTESHEITGAEGKDLIPTDDMSKLSDAELDRLIAHTQARRALSGIGGAGREGEAGEGAAQPA